MSSDHKPIRRRKESVKNPDVGDIYSATFKRHHVLNAGYFRSGSVVLAYSNRYKQYQIEFETKPHGSIMKYLRSAHWSWSNSDACWFKPGAFTTALRDKQEELFDGILERMHQAEQNRPPDQPPSGS